MDASKINEFAKKNQIKHIYWIKKPRKIPKQLRFNTIMISNQ